MARKKEWWEYLVDYIARPLTDIWSSGSAELLWKNYDNYRNNLDADINNIVNQVSDGSLSANDGLQQIGFTGSQVDPYTEQWINNKISQENTASDRDFQTSMRDTSYTSAAQQLQSLGLSPSNVIQAGQASSGVSSSAAANSHNNISMQMYAQEMAMAKQLLGMTSQMASAGVYGHALGVAKKSAGIMSAAASHSALRSMTKAENSKWDRMMNELDNMPNKYDNGPSDMSDWLLQ